MKHTRPKKPTPCAYRLLVPSDAADMIPMMKRWHADQASQTGAPRYPRRDEDFGLSWGHILNREIRDNPRFFHVGAVVGYRRDAERRVIGGRVKGFIFGHTLERLTGAPRWYGLVECLYVDPPFRHRRIAQRLIRVATQLALHAGIPAWEVLYAPGTHQARTLERAGFLPYNVLAAYVDPVTGAQRNTMPFQRGVAVQ